MFAGGAGRGGRAGGDARCALYAAEGKFCLQEVLDVVDVPEVIRGVLLCLLEAVEGRFCLREVLDVVDEVDVAEVMRGVLCTLRRVGSVCRRCWTCRR